MGTISAISDQRSAISDQRSAISVQRSAIGVQRSGKKAVLRLRAPAAEGGIEFFAGFDPFGDESNWPALERTQDYSSLLLVAGAKVNLDEVRQVAGRGCCFLPVNSIGWCFSKCSWTGKARAAISQSRNSLLWPLNRVVSSTREIAIAHALLDCDGGIPGLSRAGEES